MAKVLEAVQRFSKIEQITSTRDEAPPVYLMDEIAETAKSSPDTAVSIADHCAKLLGHRNPVVKYKTLRLIRHLCNKGCSQFQRGMQRYAGQIRELVHYKGEQDPFKGDAPNQRVRDAAKEAVELIFNSTAAAQNPQSVSTQGRIKGFGSGGGPADSGATYSYSAGSTGGGSSTSTYGSGGIVTTAGSRMMGFGSDSRPPSSCTPQPTASVSLNTGASGRTVWGANSSAGTGTRSTLAVPGSISGGGGSSGRSGGSYDPSAFTAPPAGYSMAVPLSGPTVGGEELLVDDLCAAGGLRSVPDAAELKRFVDSVSIMDGLRVAELLREKMQAVSWQVVLRALCALEAVLNLGMTQACGEVAIMFQSDTDPVWQQATNSSHQQVRERAAKVLKLLTGDDVGVTPGPEAVKKGGVAAAAKRRGGDDLLGEDGGSPAAAAPPPSALDLLGDLDFSGPSAQPAAPAGSAAYAVPTLMPPPAPLRPLGLGAFPPPPQLQPQQPPLHQQRNAGLAPLQPLPPHPAAATPASSSFNDLFSDMSLGGPLQPPAANGTGGSFSQFAAAPPAYGRPLPPAAEGPASFSQFAAAPPAFAAYRGATEPAPAFYSARPTYTAAGYHNSGDGRLGTPAAAGSWGQPVAGGASIDDGFGPLVGSGLDSFAAPHPGGAPCGAPAPSGAPSGQLACGDPFPSLACAVPDLAGTGGGTAVSTYGTAGGGQYGGNVPPAGSSTGNGMRMMGGLGNAPKQDPSFDFVKITGGGGGLALDSGKKV